MSTAWFGLGNVYEKIGEHAEAADAFRRAGELSPEMRFAWYSLGVCYIRLGKRRRRRRSSAGRSRSTPRSPTPASSSARSSRRVATTGGHRGVREVIDLVLPRGCALQPRADLPPGGGRFEAAAEHYRAYLELRPDAPDAAEVQGLDRGDGRGADRRAAPSRRRAGGGAVNGWAGRAALCDNGGDGGGRPHGTERDPEESGAGRGGAGTPGHAGPVPFPDRRRLRVARRGRRGPRFCSPRISPHGTRPPRRPPGARWRRSPPLGRVHRRRGLSAGLGKDLLGRAPGVRRALLGAACYPLCRAAGRLLGRSAEAVGASFIAYSNALAVRGAARPGGGGLLVLPRCLQREGCAQAVSMDVRNCRRCGGCDLSNLVPLMERYGFQMAVATGGRLARALVRDLEAVRGDRGRLRARTARGIAGIRGHSGPLHRQSQARGAVQEHAGGPRGVRSRRCVVCGEVRRA